MIVVILIALIFVIALATNSLFTGDWVNFTITAATTAVIGVIIYITHKLNTIHAREMADLERMINELADAPQNLLENDYQNLGLNPNSSKEDLESKYRQLQVAYHPDKNLENPNLAKNKFVKATESYERILKHRFN